jgi:hypothetical protein
MRGVYPCFELTSPFAVIGGPRISTQLRV